MLEQARGSDYAIWLVAMLLYVLDAAKLLAARELLLVEAPSGFLAARVSGNPFGTTGRVLTFSPLLLPHRGVFVASWGRPWSERAGLAAMLESLQQLRTSLVIGRILATWSFILLFILGPVLTVTIGSDAAVLYTAVLVYSTVFGAIVVLWWQRRDFRLTVVRCAMLSGEILVCPAFLPNLVRKITSAYGMEADAAQILAATASSETRKEILRRLEDLTEELIEETASDPREHARLRAYLVTVRGAR